MVTTSRPRRNLGSTTKRRTAVQRGQSRLKKVGKNRTSTKNTKINVKDSGFTDELEEETRLACVVIENVETDIPLDEVIVRSSPLCDVTKVTIKKDQSPRRYTYHCFKCGKDMRNRSRLNLHMKSVHNEGQEEIGILCEDCGKRVDFDHELVLHKKFLCKKVQRSFPCRVCKLSLRSKRETDSHPCTGSALKPFFCSQTGCQWSGRGFKDLVEHETRHMGIKPFLCTTCGRSFAAKKDMDRHTDTHKDSRDFKCSMCSLSYKSERSLKRHLTMHNFKNRFKCQECPFSSALRSSFNEHMLKHTKRAFICKICKKSLRSEKSLKLHIKNRHTFNRIFSCRYCDVTFDDGLRYSSHMRKHKSLKKENTTDPQQLMDFTSSTLASTSHIEIIPSTTSEVVIPIGANVVIETPSSVLTAPPIPPSSMMTLAAGALSDEDIGIAGQNPDSLMVSYVATTDTTEITVMTSEMTSGGLLMYNVDIPPGSETLPTCSAGILNMPPLMSDTVPNMDSEQWNNS